MRSAPSVSYPVGRSQFAGLLVLSLWLLAATVLVLWLAQPGVKWGWRQAVVGVLLLAFGVAVFLAWLRAPVGELAWDGRGWRWSGAADSGSLSVALDMQRRLLVQWHPVGGRRHAVWLWLEQARQPQRWPDLRRAVYSRASLDMHLH